jgi:hypothetical protein
MSIASTEERSPGTLRAAYVHVPFPGKPELRIVFEEDETIRRQRAQAKWCQVSVIVALKGSVARCYIFRTKNANLGKF